MTAVTPEPFAGTPTRTSTGIRRCSIVADRTLTAGTLGEAVGQRIAGEPHEFSVVAPTTPLRDESTGPQASST